MSETQAAVPPSPVLARRASLNAFAAAVDYGVRVGIQLVLAPLMLRTLGVFGFSAWQVLQRLIGHSTPAGGRPTEALKWVVANRQSSGDLALKREQVGTAVVTWALFLPLVLVVGGVLSWISPHLVGASPDDTWTVRAAAGLLVLNVVLLGIAGLPQAVLQGENLGYRRLGLSTAILLVGGVAMALALQAGWGLPGLAAATLLGTALSGATCLAIVRRNVPWWGIRRPGASAVRGFVRLSGWFLLWNLVMQAMKGSDLLVLAAAAGAGAVASYSLTSLVPLAVGDTAFMIISATMPGLGGIVGAGDLPRAARVRVDTLALCWLLATAAGATMIIWLPAFLELWVGSRYDAGPVATVLICVMLLQLVLIRVDANVIDLTLQMRRKVLLGLGSVLVSVIAALVLIRLTDRPIIGLVTGFIIGRLPLSLAYPALVARLLERPRALVPTLVLRPLLGTVVLFALALSVRPEAHAGGWLPLIALGLLTAALSLAFAAGCGLPISVRRRLVQRLPRRPA